MRVCLRPARLALVTTCLAGMTVAAGCNSTKEGEPTLRLASIWEVTGQVAQFGEAANKAVSMAVEEFNATRPQGVPAIKLLVQDTQSTPAGAASALQAALAQGRPIAVLGPLTSGAAMVLAPICEREKIVLMTTASVPEFTNAGPFSFRIYPSDAFEALRMAAFAKERGAGRVAVVYPQNDYGVGLDAAFGAAAGPELSVIERLPYPAEQSDFRAVAARVASGRPDFVYAPGYPATVGPLARALRAAGIRGPIYSSLGIEDPSLFELGGKAVDGILYTVTSIPEGTTNPSREAFEKRYRDKYGAAPNFPALYGFDVAQVVLAALLGGARTPADLQEAFADGAEFSGVTGRFTFDANGDVRRAYQIKQVDAASRAFKILEASRK